MLLFFFFIFLLLFICAYKTWFISPPCPHPLPYHPLHPLPLPPSIRSRNYFALISNFVVERKNQEICLALYKYFIFVNEEPNIFNVWSSQHTHTFLCVHKVASKSQITRIKAGEKRLAF
jgi:hypothetical protein